MEVSFCKLLHDNYNTCKTYLYIKFCCASNDATKNVKIARKNVFPKTFLIKSSLLKKYRFLE